ncbi:MAG: hypothetical protein KA143_12615 [Saprospiraceae bacterium]|jgi:hypothetical protein|nr:hypothetical protein [Saprospiraceae bacterium]
MERLKSSSQQWQAAAIGLIFVCIGFMAKVFYREYIYSHHINDFGMADWLPSFFYVIGFSYLLMVSQVIAPLLITVIVTIASILFEIKQCFTSGKFDWPDILASLAGGIITVLLYTLINNRKRY